MQIRHPNFRSPRLPFQEPIKRLCLFVWSVAQVQTRVMVALIVAGAAFVGMTLFWLYASLAMTANNGIVAGVLAFLFFEAFLTLPLVVSGFFIVTITSLRVRKWRFEHVDRTIHESWEHPLALLNAQAIEVRRWGRERVVLATSWGTPMPSARTHVLIGSAQLVEALDVHQLEEDFRDPERERGWGEVLNQVMWGGVGLAALFVMLAVYSDNQAAAKLAGG